MTQKGGVNNDCLSIDLDFKLYCHHSYYHFLLCNRSNEHRFEYPAL